MLDNADFIHRYRMPSSGPSCRAGGSRTTRRGCSYSPWRTTWLTSFGNWCYRSRSQGWTLTTLREKLIKIGAKVGAHAKYVTFQLAEVAVPRQLFAQILDQIARLCPTCASG
jgi:hypothetical protein